MSCSKARDLTWQAATCSDRQNPPDTLPWGRWRDSLNILVDEDVALRRGGWTRWAAEYDVEDPDLHGQGIRSLYSWSREWGRRELFASSSSGVWKWLHPGTNPDFEDEGSWLSVGGIPALEPGERRSMAGLGNVLVLGGGVGGTTNTALSTFNVATGVVGSVTNTIGLTSANVIVEWRGVFFYLDVVMGGVRVGHRALWSDFNIPTSVDPGLDSIAGFQDLDPGEFILNAGVSGDSLYLFTDRSIWRVVATGDDEVYRFQQVFKNTTGHRCLHAPYTFDTLPDGNFIYLGDNGRIYIYSPYQAAPEEPEWLAVGTPDLKKRLGSCKLFAGKVCDNGGTLEYLISYPESEDAEAPTATYSVDFDRLCVGRIDHGFWTFATWYSFVAECPRPTQLILSSAEDDSLKEARFFDTFTRERWDSTSEEWTLDTYTSELWTGALGFDLPDKNKRMTRMDVLAHTPADQTAGTIRLYVGGSNYPAEPATYFASCPITWYTLSTKTVPCAAATSVPVPWRFVVENRYLYFRLVLSGEACALSRIVANVEAV